MAPSKDTKQSVVAQALQRFELMFDVAEDHGIAELAAIRNALANSPAALKLFDLAHGLKLDDSPLPFYMALEDLSDITRMEVWTEWSAEVPVNQFDPQFFSAIIAAAMEEKFFNFMWRHEAMKQKE
jgi:hypothetical protein